MQELQRWTWPSTSAIICARLFPNNGDSLVHVARLIDEYLVESLDDRILAEACEAGASPSDLDFLLARTVPSWKKVIEAAVRGGHLHVFRWMVERQDDLGPWGNDFDYAMPFAAYHGHLETMKWLHERDLGSVTGMNVARAPSSAARMGHLAIVKWLVRKGASVTGFELGKAAQIGHLAMVQWIYDNIEGPVKTSGAMAAAAWNGDLDMLQWLHQQKSCSEACTTHVMDAAVNGGHFHVVEWLLENCSKAFANPGAASAGNIRMLQLMYYSDRFGSCAMDGPASGGHLDTVKWLHEHRPEGCTSLVMDAAARNGHLEVVRWLHDNRTEGCTTDAMDGAARSGHLHIVKWLHENRAEGCTESALQDAARNGHLDVLRWLVEHFPDKCGDDLMEIAGRKGHLDVVQYLDENTKQRASAWGLGAAAKQGWLEILQVLLEHDQSDGKAEDRRVVCEAFDKTLTQLSCHHATPVSSLWAKALESLEFFDIHKLYRSVILMLERALRRGYLALVQQFMDRRSERERRKYGLLAAWYRNVVLLRWLLSNRTSSTPINVSSLKGLAASFIATEYVEAAGYFSECDRVQLVCQAIRKNYWQKLLRWVLENTSFNDNNSRATIRSTINRAQNDTEQWLYENLTNAEARKWCLPVHKQ